MNNLGRIFASRLRFLTAAEKMLICKVYNKSDSILEIKISDIEEIIGRRLKKNLKTLEIARSESLKADKIIADSPIKCIFLGDSKYPKCLSEIYNPPFALYYRGTLPKLELPAIAIVGTRLASGTALDTAFELGFSFAENGFSVISGLALGADSAGHYGAVVAGGLTFAVLGCGVDSIYPLANKELAAKIVEKGGAIISEYLPGESARRHHFVERNRIISGLSRGVIVVQAPGKSGALITADFALEQGRDLYIHKTAIADCKSESHLYRLIYDGAPVINSYKDVLKDWHMPIKEKNRKNFNLKNTDSLNAGLFMADRIKSELEGKCIKFNGKFFGRGCNESPHSFSGRVTG